VLQKLAVDVDVILHMIQCSKETLRRIYIEEVDLISGSRNTVFVALEQLPLLDSLYLCKLYQRMRTRESSRTDIEGQDNN
jgi:hypothetical protein